MHLSPSNPTPHTMNPPLTASTLIKLKNNSLDFIFKSVRTLSTTLFLGWLLSDPCQAKILVKTNFDDGFGTGSLAEQPAILGNPNDAGFSGAFTYAPCSADVSAGKHLAVSSGVNLTYNVSGGGTIVGGTNAVSFTTSCFSDSTTATRLLPTAITGQDVYVSIVLDPIAAGQSATTDLLFTLGSPSIYSPFIGIYNSKAGAGFFGAYGASASSTTPMTSSSGPHLLVARFVWNSNINKYDSVQFWLNPTAGASATPTSSVTDTAHAFASFNAMGLYATNMTTNSEYAFDSLVIGTTWNDVIPVAGASETDPTGGAVINWENPNWGGYPTGPTLCSEAFSQAGKATMTAAQGATVLDFEQTSGFQASPYQLGATGALNPVPTLSTNKALTAVTTPSGTAKMEWRSYNMTNDILSAPDATQGIYLAKDRASGSATMVSGSQGITASVLAGVNAGTYLTFDKDISKFSVVINSNAEDYQPLVVLFDASGVAIRKYFFGGVGKGLSTYFGIISPSSLIRSVWIGQNGTNAGLVLDDIAFVPGLAPSPVQTFSFANGAAGWSSTSGTVIGANSTYTSLQGPSGPSDAKLYRSITLNAGTYEIKGTGNGVSTCVWVSPLFDLSYFIGALNLTQSSTWRTDHQRFKVSQSGTYLLVIPAGAAPGYNNIQAVTISPVTPTPYSYDTGAMATQRAALGVSRGVQCLQQWEPLGAPFFADLKNTWKCNVVRYNLRMDGTPATLAASLARAKVDMDSAPAGLKFAIALAGPLNNLPANIDYSSHAYWSRADLNEAYCETLKMVVSTLAPTHSARIWGYDIWNEPHDVDQMPNPPREWWPIAVNVLRTIRSIDPYAWVIYETGPGGQFSGFYDLSPLPDTANRIIYSAHFYEPMPFTHQGVYSSLADLNWPNANDPLSNYSSTTTNLAAWLAPVDDFLASWPVPIYVGEFSVVRWAPKADAIAWMRDAVALFEARGWSWTYFAWQSWNGWRLDMDNVYGKEHFGPFNAPMTTVPYLPPGDTDSRGKVIFDALNNPPTP